MKIGRRIRIFSVIGSVLLCAVFSSCSEEDFPSDLRDTIWLCNYPVYTENNDTKEMEYGTGCISLQFRNSGKECIVEKSIEGLISLNRSFYEVKWYSKDTFTLCKTEGNQTIQYYSGTIKGDMILFEFLSCDKVEMKLELKKVYL